MPDEWYRAFILGDWDAMMPTASVIPFKLVEKARKRTEAFDSANIVWGIDCGHLGTDKTWIAQRAGFKFDFIDGWGQTRIDQTVRRIAERINEAIYAPRRIVIDYDGIGAGVADGLMGLQEQHEISPFIEIVGLHAQKTADMMPLPKYVQMRYANAKAQNLWELRRMLESGRGDFPEDDDVLDQDLTSPNYDIIDSRIYIETKKLVRTKLGRSPDKGDAVALTMWDMATDEFAGLPTAIEEQQVIENDQPIAYAESMEKLAAIQSRGLWHTNPFRLEQEPEEATYFDLGY
jgi:phage terminase large subunit